MDQLFVLLKAVNILVHIVHVSPAVVDDELTHAQSQGAVSARLDLEEDVCQVFSCGGFADIDDDDLTAPGLQCLHAAHREMVGVITVIVPPEIRIGVAHIRTTYRTGGHLMRDDHRAGTTAVIGPEVYTSEHMGKTVEHRPVPLAVTTEEGHRVGAVLFTGTVLMN